MTKEPVKFTLVGDGPEKTNLMNQAKELDNIIFLSPVPKYTSINRKLSCNFNF